jgi:predicted alpha/beta superfamily hydrolase
MDSAGHRHTTAASGEIRSHHDFPSAILNNRRTLTVFLPPGYRAETTIRYPVLYLHDGQNLFDPARAAFGVTWRANATTERLLRAGRIRPIILVGIDNTPDREDEYAVWRDGREKTGGHGHLYAQFVLDEVKPFIDTTYRTLSGREHTAVAGASLGGLVSLTMARAHHDRFALCGLLSPSLWWAQCRVLRELEKANDLAWLRGMRFWVDVGTREGNRRGHVPSCVEQARRLIARFDDAGLVPGRDYYYWEVAGGEHNEAAWANRLDKVLLYFFGQ